MKYTNLYTETDRLIIRPFQNENFANWYKGFDERLPSQYKYDDGHSDMSNSTEEWFIKWIEWFIQAAKKDEMYILGVFRKED